MSRPFIREPNLANRWLSGDFSKAFCISCNKLPWFNNKVRIELYLSQTQQRWKTWKFILLTEGKFYPAHEKPLGELVAHLPKLLDPIKLDTLIFLPTSLLLHSGQEIFLSSPLKTSFSNSFWHCLHWYSKMGMGSILSYIHGVQVFWSETEYYSDHNSFFPLVNDHQQSKWSLTFQPAVLFRLNRNKSSPEIRAAWYGMVQKNNLKITV